MPAAEHRVFDALMPYDVYVYRLTKYDGYGSPEYSDFPLGPYKAMVVDRIATARDTQGLEVRITTTAYINTDGERINSDDRILLPDQYGGDKRKIANATNWPDPEDGQIYAVEVNFL